MYRTDKLAPFLFDFLKFLRASTSWSPKGLYNFTSKLLSTNERQRLTEKKKCKQWWKSNRKGNSWYFPSGSRKTVTCIIDTAISTTRHFDRSSVNVKMFLSTELISIVYKI